MKSVVDDMRGRVALVTGASAGIGRAVASGLAERGATVLAVSRAGGAGAEVVDALRAGTGNPDHRFLPADLSAQGEVRAVAAEITRQVPRLDVLVNNAGGFFARRRVTIDGIERTFALDHLASVLLTLLLLEPLAAARGRVVLTTSLVAPWGRVHRDVQLRRGYNGVSAYAQARLGNVLFAQELARRVPADALTINAFDPGVVRTELGQGPGFLNLCIRVAQAGFGRGPDAAAQTALTLACSPELDGATGGLWKDGRRLPTPRVARDPRVAARLWEVSLRMLELSDEELAPLRRLEALARGRAT
ncbi:MAG: SDR family NAD(P)-dependent oxidoreductase [Deinococcales bacterium]